LSRELALETMAPEKKRRRRGGKGYRRRKNGGGGDGKDTGGEKTEGAETERMAAEKKRRARRRNGWRRRSEGSRRRVQGSRRKKVYSGGGGEDGPGKKAKGPERQEMVPGGSRKANTRRGNTAGHLLIGSEPAPNAMAAELIRPARHGIPARDEQRAPEPERMAASPVVVAPVDQTKAMVGEEKAPGAGSIAREPGPKGSGEAPMRPAKVSMVAEG
jgi:hypothetical protein